MKKQKREKFSKFETFKLSNSKENGVKGGFWSGRTGTCTWCDPDPSDPDRLH